MKTLYIECNMGAAGDMLMSALLELHPNAEEFLNRLNKLGIPNVTVSKTASVKCGITGTHIDVNVNGEHEDEHMHDHHDHHHDHHHHHHHTGMHEIEHIIEHFDILLHFFAEKRGHFYGTVAFRCFRACNNITPFGTVVRLADRDRLLLEIKISSSKSQQLTGTDTAPVKHFKSIKGTWLIHHGF